VIDEFYGKEKLSQNELEEGKEKIAKHLTISKDQLTKKLGTRC